MRYKSWIDEMFKEQFQSIGRQEGRNEGISIGEARGEERARRSIMDNLIATGMPPAQAASLTGLSV